MGSGVSRVPSDERLRSQILVKLHLAKRKSGPELTNETLLKQSFEKAASHRTLNELNLVDFQRAARRLGFRCSDALVRKVFERFDSDHNNSISLGEFMQFLQHRNGRLSGSLSMPALPQPPRGGSRSISRARSQSPDSMASPVANLGCSAGHPSSRGTSQLEPRARFHPNHRRRRMSEAQRRAREVQLQLEKDMAAMLGDVDDFNTAGRAGKDKRLRHISTRDRMIEIAFETKWEIADLERLRDDFHSLESPDCVAELDFKTFELLLRKRRPELANSPLLPELMALLDTDGNGRISFDEFVVGMTRAVGGSLEEKLGLWFDVMSKRRGTQGPVSKLRLEDLIEFVDSGQRDLYDASLFSQQIVGLMDGGSGESGRQNHRYRRSKDRKRAATKGRRRGGGGGRGGALSRDEFVGTIKDNRILQQCFSQALSMPLPAETVEAARTVGALVPAFSFEVLKKLWANVSTTKDGFHDSLASATQGVSLNDFKRVVRDHVRMEHERGEAGKAQKLERGAMAILDMYVKELFEKLDTDGDGLCDFRELLIGMSQVLCGDSQERAKFLFGLFDHDGSGTLDVDELERIFTIFDNRREKSADLITAALSVFDANGDGTIDAREFAHFCDENPQFTQAMQGVFGALLR